MRRVRRTLLALWLAWSLLPGGSELIEQTMHLITKGHLAHSIPNDPDESPLGEEHDCQGLMHSCHCHNVSGRVASALGPEWRPWLESVSGFEEIFRQPPEPPSRGVFHPPESAPATV